jgi:tripartite-type tricarboxylate transporter receptor subunit TctC
MITATHHIANPTLYKKVPYDILKDITNIALIAVIPNVLLAHPSFPPNSVEELIALAKSKPGQINYASTGIGGANHLCGEMFKIMAKIDIVHIPYKGQAPAFNDLLAGHVSLMFNTIDVSLPHLKVGKLKALGVTSSKRSQVAPQIPTISESGLPGYENVSWFGLYGPPNMEKDIISKLNYEFVKALHTPDIIKRFTEFGAEPGGMGVHEFDTYVKSEYAKISKLIKDLGIKLD